MTSIIADITMSLDGFVTGPNPGPSNGLGDGGEALHDWVFGGTADDTAVLDRAAESTGAVILGRNLFDVVDGPDGWRDDLGYGGRRDEREHPPCFVVTHAPPAHVRLADRFTMCATLEEAVERATRAAGDKDVVIMGGGAIIASALRAGVVDVLVLHVAPLALGAGTPLWRDVDLQLKLQHAVSTPNAQHLTYRVA